MALVPAGTFSLGKAKKETKAFCIDVTEVTVAAYRACVDAGVCTTKGLDEYGPCNWGALGRDRHPINCLSWHQAARYCSHVGKRLPSEEEWFHAAYGGDGRAYPWGNDAPSGQLCWDGEGNALGKGKRAGTTCPVGSYPAGRSPFGLEDMAGNVWEWTTGRIRVREDHSRRGLDDGPRGLGRIGLLHSALSDGGEQRHRRSLRALTSGAAGVAEQASGADDACTFTTSYLEQDGGSGPCL
ncbi:MAG: SUMF1/EgtB/PvdO family nonheme iron enzyme [Minicystis sp.]